MGQEKSGIVTKEEMERIGKLPPGKGHWVSKQMNKLEVGQTLHVLRADWHWTNKTPNVIVSAMNSQGPKRFEFSEAADDKGWFIERLS
jgi:hypothetical protein